MKGFAYFEYMKKALLLTGIVVLACFAAAHEFWLLPNKFYYTIREVAIIRFKVGENFSGENWRGDSSKVSLLVYVKPSGETENLAAAISGRPGDSLRVPLQEEGTHMVIFNSTNSFISLEPEKFNAYLRADGLDEATAFRKQRKEENKTGTELYQRSVKTIFQAGSTLTNACTEPTDLPLDIIPFQNPYMVPKPGKVRFRVLFKKHPLPNALVRFWYETKGKGVQTDSARTNNRGFVNGNRYPGHFMVSCVHMEHTRNNTGAEWQSYWGSLSFEYSQFFPGSAIR